MLQLPVTKNGNSDMTVSIDSVLYTLKYKYNTRNRRIYLSLFLDEVPIIEGIRLIEGSAPILNYPIPELEGSQLYVLKDLEGTGFATLGNFGVNQEFTLIYFKESELE